MPTIYERVKEIVVDKLGADEADIQEGSSFVEDLDADSLDLVELIMAFEEEFSTEDSPLEIPDEDAGSIVTVSNVVTYLKGRGIKDDEPTSYVPIAGTEGDGEIEEDTELR